MWGGGGGVAVWRCGGNDCDPLKCNPLQTVHTVEFDSAVSDTEDLVARIREAHTQNGEPEPGPARREAAPLLHCCHCCAATHAHASITPTCLRASAHARHACTLPAPGGPFLSIAIAQHGPDNENEWVWTSNLTVSAYPNAHTHTTLPHLPPPPLPLPPARLAHTHPLPLTVLPICAATCLRAHS